MTHKPAPLSALTKMRVAEAASTERMHAAGLDPNDSVARAKLIRDEFSAKYPAIKAWYFSIQEQNK